MKTGKMHRHVCVTRKRAHGQRSSRARAAAPKPAVALAAKVAKKKPAAPAKPTAKPTAKRKTVSPAKPPKTAPKTAPKRVRKPSPEPVAARAPLKAVKPPAKPAAAKPVKVPKPNVAPPPDTQTEAKPSGYYQPPSRRPVPADPLTPPRYSPALRDKICDLVSVGKTWDQIVATGLVGRRTLGKWLNTIPDFKHHYDIARQCRAETLVADIDTLIAMLGDRELYEGLSNSQALTMVAGIRGQIQGLQWEVGKYFPRAYGDRMHHEHEMVDAKPNDQYDMTKLEDGEVKELRRILAKARKDPEHE